MATHEERRALLAVTCPWCKAEPGTACFVLRPARTETERGSRRLHRFPIRTLDGGCHDARWTVALGRSAAVVPDALPETRTSRREAVSVGVERPW